MDENKIFLRNKCITRQKKTSRHKKLYTELKRLARIKIVKNINRFTCVVCTEEYGPRKGVVLSGCLHVFCMECIKSYVKMSTDVEIKCPYLDDSYSCEQIISHSEIKRLVGKKIFDGYLKRSLNVAVNAMEDVVRCPTLNCGGLYIKDDDILAEHWRCEMCNIPYCLVCEGLHNTFIMSCADFKKTLEDVNIHSQHTVAAMLDTSKAMKCPTCGVVIEKNTGCDYLRCTQCLTYLCWATKGARWGPKGVGDTSGGCGCSQERKCHPECRNCH